MRHSKPSGFIRYGSIARPVSHTIDSPPLPVVSRPPSRRVTVAVVIAVALHGILLTLPVSLYREPPPRPAPLRITISQPPAPEVAPAEPVDHLAEPELPAEPEPPVKTANPVDPVPATPEKPIRTEKKTTPPAPQQDTAGSTDRPATPESGAKSRSTVFDPRLARELARERNRVKAFDPGDAEVMTATGTFIRKGNHCEEVKKVLPGDIDNNLTQPFTIKCTKRRRPREDIDRLAREYGIP